MNENDNAAKDFPILCETCLGPNPCLRMTKQPFGKACSICERPMTLYRWKPGPKARYKCTEICQTCAKLKNVCQTCVLDLQFGLPVQVRDAALADTDRVKVPENHVNMQFAMEQAEQQMALPGAAGDNQGGYGKVDVTRLGNSNVMKRVNNQRDPYYKRNLPHLCSFYAKGECNRGEQCPYRHEMPTDGPLANQNVKDRYYGKNDPVAEKILGTGRFTGFGSGSASLPEPPADKSITTIWVGGVDEKMTEQEIRVVFYPYGEVTSVRCVPHRHCGFVTFARRDSAEEAIKSLYKDCKVGNTQLRLAWGKARAGAPPGMKSAPKTTDSVAPLVSNPEANKYLQPPTAPEASSFTLAPPPGMKGAKPYYPSMDPKTMASKIETD